MNPFGSGVPVWRIKVKIPSDKSILPQSDFDSCLYGAQTYQNALKQMHRRVLRKYQCSHPELIELARVGINTRRQ